MNLASDVPPVVENFGLTFVIFLIIFFAKNIVLSGLVKNESPLARYSILNLHLFFLHKFLIIELILFFKDFVV